MHLKIFIRSEHWLKNGDRITTDQGRVPHWTIFTAEYLKIQILKNQKNDFLYFDCSELWGANTKNVSILL